MTTYTIKKDGETLGEKQDLVGAIALADELLDQVPAGTLATLVIEKDEYHVLAVTNRRIIGLLTKQQWEGHRGDEAVPIGRVEFDATDAVLLMNYQQLIELQDDDDKTDELGLAHVEWAGPCIVRVVSSICAYFGIEDLRDLPESALKFARERVNPVPPTEEVVTLTIKVRARVAPGADMNDFVNELSYIVKSNTEGVIVRSTEVVGNQDEVDGLVTRVKASMGDSPAKAAFELDSIALLRPATARLTELKANPASAQLLTERDDFAKLLADANVVLTRYDRAIAGEPQGYISIGTALPLIGEVMMQDVVGEYDSVEEVPEWAWVEAVSSYAHTKNGTEGGPWEFIVNLSMTLTDIPERLVPVFMEARDKGLSYLVFNQ